MIYYKINKVIFSPIFMALAITLPQNSQAMDEPKREFGPEFAFLESSPIDETKNKRLEVSPLPSTEFGEWPYKEDTSFPNLKSLTLKCIDLNSVPWEQLTGVTNLDLRSCRIENFNSWTKLTNLTHLFTTIDFEHRQSFKSNLTNGLTQSLRDLTNIESLDVYCNKCTSGDIETLTKLRRLALDDSSVLNPEVFNNLTNLESLNLEKTRIERTLGEYTFDDFKYLTELRSLHLRVPYLINNSISHLTNLRRLSYDKSDFLNKESLTCLKNLLFSEEMSPYFIMKNGQLSTDPKFATLIDY